MASMELGRPSHWSVVWPAEACLGGAICVMLGHGRSAARATHCDSVINSQRYPRQIYGWTLYSGQVVPQYNGGTV